MNGRTDMADMNKIIWLLIILVLAIYVLFPIFRNGFLITDDGNWMVIRLSAFYQSLREGQFPVRFLGRLNYSYGYPVSNFLYPGFLYVGSVIHILGIPFQATVEIIIIGFIFLGAVALFYWLQHFFDTKASALGTMSFLLSPYILYDIFKRGSVGEIVAIGTCMFVIYAIESKNRWLLSPSLAFLLISHNTLALFYLPVLIGYVIIRKRWALIFSFFVGVGISMFFWLPVLYEKRQVIFDSISVSDPSHYFAVSNSLILQNMPFLILAGLSVLLTKQHIEKIHWFFLFILFFSVFFASGVSEGIWKIHIIEQVAQFPYRFLALISFIGPWFVAFIADKKKLIPGVLLSIFALGIFLYLAIPYQHAQSVLRPEGYFTTNEDTTTVANEYMPKWVQKFPFARASKRVEVFKGNATIEERSVSTEKINILVHAKELSIIQINTIYYPGWGAIVDEGPINIAHDNEYGLMRLTIPIGDHRIFMAFRETKSRFLADIITIVCILIWLIQFVILPLTVSKSPAVRLK